MKRRQLSIIEATPNTGNEKPNKDRRSNNQRQLLGLRKSPRLANKSVSAPTTTSLIKPKKTKSKMTNPGLVAPFRSSWCPSDFNLIQHRQNTLKISLRRFPRYRFVFGPENETRTCIMSSGGGDTFSWTEKSALVSWIGMSAGDTKCVLSIDLQLGKKRIPNPAEKHYQTIGTTAEKAVCDMGDTCSELRQMIAQRSGTGPFAVVCLAPDIVEDDQESSSHEVLHQQCRQDSRAINFLVEKLKNRSALTVEETMQIAVCALQYLFGAKFDSSEIQLWGYGFDGVRRCGQNLKLLPSLVEKYLAANSETTTSGAFGGVGTCGV